MALTLTALTPGSVFASLGARPEVLLFSSDLEVFPQNFAIETDNNGHVFVGGTDGVMEFDGERWFLTPVPNKDIIRSLQLNGDGRLYVGGYDEFGYMERDDTGTFVYTSLTPLFADQLGDELFADIWEILIVDGAVFFRGLNHVFYWHPSTDTKKIWRREERFGVIATHKGQTILQFRGEGFRSFDGEDWQPMPHTSALSDLIIATPTLPDGSFLTIGREGTWYRFDNNEVSVYEMPPGLPDSSAFSAGVTLSDGTIALAGENGDLYFYDPLNSDFQKVTVTNSFIGEVLETDDGHILAVSNDGFHSLPWPANWQLWDVKNGLRGDILNILETPTAVYALTDSGVLTKAIDEAVFQKLDWTKHEAWDALPVGNGEILLAESYAMKVIENGNAKDISHNGLYPRVISRSKHNPNLVYVGTEEGIALFERVMEEWQLVFETSDMRNLRVNSIVETGPNQITIGSDRGGVQSIKFHHDQRWTMETTMLSKADGIDYGDSNLVEVIEFEGKVLASTMEGIFQQTGNGFALYPTNNLSDLRDDEHLSLSTDGKSLWAYAYNQIYKRQRDGNWQEIVPEVNKHGGINITRFDSEGRTMFGSGASLLLYDERITKEKAKSAPYLTEISVKPRGGSQSRLPLHQAVSVIPQDNWLYLHYTQPSFLTPGKTKYRVRMLPIEEDFSDWSTGPRRSYFGMEPGDFEFQIQSMNTLGELSEVSSYRVRVQPHWYETRPMIFVWVLTCTLLAAIIVWCLITFRSRQLERKNQQLEQMVKERTRELESANRQLEHMAHLDGLTEIPNRRKLDDYLRDVWIQCTERDRIMAVVILDVDHFKQFNDRNGHIAGDELLRSLAKMLSHCLRRAEDLVARYGGEEFLAVLPGADVSAAMEVAEKMRTTVARSQLGITISAGVASTQDHLSPDIETLIEFADDALYTAKHSGRNRVMVHKAA